MGHSKTLSVSLRSVLKYMKLSNVAERQRGRASYLRELDDAFVREKADKRRQLQRRVERRALQYQVMVETVELEKELEARYAHTPCHSFTKLFQLHN